MTKNFVLIYTTVPDKKTGKTILNHLLKKELIACGNLFSEATSYFHWKKQIQTQKEFVLILKTLNRFYKKVETEITKIHPYDCPCILSLSVKEGYKPFLKWINSCLDK